MAPRDPEPPDAPTPAKATKPARAPNPETPPRAPKAPKPPKPPKPWSRTEAGRYESSDGRFTLGSDGAGRWFATDAESLDELGLARTLGPFATLDAAKTAADEARTTPAAESPLAARLAAAKDRPAPPASLGARRQRGATTSPGPAADGGREPHEDPSAGSAATDGAAPTPDAATANAPAKPEKVPATPGTAPATARTRPEPPTRTWLDDLAEKDTAAAARARSLIDALAAAGVPDANALVRRDVLGDRPAIATRLLARDVLLAVARLRDPSTAEVLAAVLDVVSTPPKRRGLPGWALVERDGPAGRSNPRPVRVTPDDLDAAARGD
jgi:hypothetical protein